MVLLVVFLLGFPALFRPEVRGTDPTGYYSWLRSAVIDGDLNTADEYAHLGRGAVGGTTDTGHWDNPYAIGSALLWAPFFLAAHAITLLVRLLGVSWPADGYGAQYVIAVSLGSALYAWLSVLLTYLLARRLFDATTALIAVLSVWLASPLVFYQYSHPIMAHANDAFVCAVFIFVWYRTRAQRTVIQYALLGAAAGLCALVRNQNTVFVLFPLAEIAYRAVAARRAIGSRRALVATVLSRTGAFSLGWWLAFTPQLITWRVVFGTWLPGNPYARSGGGDFDFLHPHIFGIFFSTNHGLFVWTPLLLAAVCGWFFLWRRDRGLTGLLAVSFALQVCVIASWSSWSGAAAFGQRFFVNMVPAFGLGLAALLSALGRRVAWRWLAAGCASFVVWNGLLLLRYALEDIPRASEVPLDRLVLGQFTLIVRFVDHVVHLVQQRF